MASKIIDVSLFAKENEVTRAFEREPRKLDSDLYCALCDLKRNREHCTVEELRVMDALSYRKHYNDWVSGGYAEEHYKDYALDVMAPLPTQYTVMGTYGILLSFLLYGSDVIYEKDREHALKILDSLHHACLLWHAYWDHAQPDGAASYDQMFTEGEREFDRLFKTVRRGFNIKLDSLLEIAAAMDSLILFAFILRDPVSQTLCRETRLFEILVHRGAKSCLAYFVEINPWSLDFSCFDFRYYYALFGDKAADYKVRESSQNAINYPDRRALCVQYLADKFLDPGWERRWPIGLEDTDMGMEYLLGVVAYLGCQHLVSCVENRALSVESINNVVATMASEEKFDADDIFNVIKAIDRDAIRECLNSRTYGRVLSKLRRMEPRNWVTVGSCRFPSYAYYGCGLVNLFQEVYRPFDGIDTCDTQEPVALLEQLAKQMTDTTDTDTAEGWVPTEPEELRRVVYSAWCALDSDGKVTDTVRYVKVTDTVRDVWVNRFSEKDRENALRALCTIYKAWSRSRSTSIALYILMLREVLTELLLLNSEVLKKQEELNRMQLKPLTFD